MSPGDPDYLILGACNPPLAHQALGVDRQIGPLLPCNIVVRATGDTTLVEALGTRAQWSTGEPAMSGLTC